MPIQRLSSSSSKDYVEGISFVECKTAIFYQPFFIKFVQSKPPLSGWLKFTVSVQYEHQLVLYLQAQDCGVFHTPLAAAHYS